MLNLNFDMLGSPNHASLVYDGDFSDTPPPATAPTVNPGAAEIESAVHRPTSTASGHAGRADRLRRPLGLQGRSRTTASPAGGLFTGAEVPKTAGPGGQVGRPRRTSPSTPTTTSAGDTINNVDLVAFEQMAKAAAFVTGIYASRTLNAGGGAAAPAVAPGRAEPRATT